MRERLIFCGSYCAAFESKHLVGSLQEEEEEEGTGRGQGEGGRFTVFSGGGGERRRSQVEEKECDEGANTRIEVAEPL